MLFYLWRGIFMRAASAGAGRRADSVSPSRTKEGTTRVRGQVESKVGVMGDGTPERSVTPVTCQDATINQFVAERS